MVKKFVTRRVEIGAMQYTEESFEDIRRWTFFEDGPESRQRFRKRDHFTANDRNEFPVEIFDELHQSWIKVSLGQWIVKGAKGEFYPCDDQTFHWKYVPVADEIEECPFDCSYCRGDD